MKEKNDMNFGAKDFERYYSGEMSGKEMYALEKAALADPFLQEALEGYQHTANANLDIDSLQEKLSNRLSEKKEARIIPWNKNSFLKVAVLIAFLSGAAYIFLTQNNNKIENNSLASTSSAEIKEATADTALPPIKNDVALLETPAPTSTPVIELNKKVTEDKTVRNANRLDKSVARTLSAEANNYAEDIAVASAPVLKNEKLKESYLIKGKVVNEEGEPIPFASIVTNKEQINTDIAGNYTAYIKDSSMYGNVVATGYMSLQKKLDPNLSQTIVLNSEIAKTDKLAQIESSQSAKKAVIKIRGNNSIAEEGSTNKDFLEPENGWTIYEQYLKDSVRYQTDSRAIVQLTFTVNQQGRPQEIKVIDGLCLPCNTEAIRLLKEGPNWKPLPKGKGLLKVQF